MNKLISQQLCFGSITRIEQDYKNSKINAESRQNEIWLTLKNLENVLSPYNKESSISMINESAGKKESDIDYHTKALLKESINYSTLTNGAFDITIGPLLHLWGFGYKKTRVPSPVEIEKDLPLINYKLINLNAKETKAILLKEGQYIHPGAIAKGFACDLLKKKFENSNLHINMGGNIQLINSEKMVGIQAPFDKPGIVACAIKVFNKSVVTSGINQRYFRNFFKLYHHLLDPKSGMQPKHNLASVTVISQSSTKADALATAFFILGIEKSREIIKKENIDVIFINKKRKIFCTADIFEKLSTAHKFLKLHL